MMGRIIRINGARLMGPLTSRCQCTMQRGVWGNGSVIMETAIVSRTASISRPHLIPTGTQVNNIGLWDYSTQSLQTFDMPLI